FASRLRRKRPAREHLFGSTGAPGTRRQPAYGDAGVADRVAVHVNCDGRRGERKGIGFAVADLVVGRSAARWRLRHADAQDQLAGLERCLDVRRRARLAMEPVERDAALAVGAGHVDRGIESHEGDREVAGIDGDAVVAAAEQRMTAVDALMRSAAAAGPALVA